MKVKKNILIIGASGHAKVIIDIVEKQNLFDIVGLIDSYKKTEERISNYDILGTEDDLQKIINKYNVFGGIIAIGDNFSRMSLFQKISKMDILFEFVTAVHPNATISKTAVIGDGSVIMAGVVVNSDAQLGIQTILNTKCSVDHDCKIGDFSSIAPGVTLGGGVEIDSCSAISLGANIIENISIGKHTVVGAGALVLKSFGDYEIAYGIPAKSIRKRKSSDKYLGLLDESFNSIEDYTLKCVTINDDEDIKTYNRLLEKFNEFNTFYSVEYCNHDLFRKLHYFLFSKKNEPGVLMPIYFKSIQTKGENETSKYYDVSSPYGFSGPLINKKVSNKDLTLFWKQVDEWYQSNQVVTEFIRFNLNNNHKSYSGYLLNTLSNVKGELRPFNEIWDNFKGKVRNNYRKAEKNGLRAEIFSEYISQDIISTFYDIYIKTMVRNNASQNYFYSRAYFEHLITNKQNKTVIAIIYFENNPISTELIIINEDTMFSFLGGTLSAYFELRPNDYLKIEVIKWGIENNFKYYALGGGRADDDSLYKYKKSFFPKDEDVIFYTGRKVLNVKVYQNLMKPLTNNEIALENSITDPNKYFPLYVDHSSESHI